MDTLNTIYAVPWVKELVAKLLFVLLLAAADALLGVILALKTGTFEWERLGNFLVRTVLPYSAAYTVVHVCMNLAQPLVGIGDAIGSEQLGQLLNGAAGNVIYAALIIGVVASLFRKLAKFGQIPQNGNGG